jgi:hypothetical protein
VQHNTVIDQDIGTAGGGGILNIQVKASAVSLTVNGAAPRTITFGSTGSDPIGTGTKANPGADATMFGFLVDRGSLDFTAATATNYVTVTTANDSSPTFIRHIWGGGGQYIGATIKMKYSFLKHLGANVDGYYGIVMEDNNGDSVEEIDHCSFTDPYRVLSAVPDDALIFRFNTITGRRSDRSIYSASSGNAGHTITDNTETAPAASGSFARFSYRPSGLTFSRNAVEGTATYVMKLLIGLNDYAAAAGSTLSYNIYRGYTPANSTSQAMANAGASTGRTWTIDHNMMDGAYQSITCCTSANTIAVSSNWLIQATESWAGQGVFFQGAGVAVLTRNVMVVETATGMATHFCYVTGASQSITGDTAVRTGPTVEGSNLHLGEPGYPCANLLVKDSVIVGGHTGILDDVSTNTWVADYAGAGAHHNNVIGYDHYAYGDNGGTNFDDGVNQHPSAVYGDHEIPPGFVDTTRRFSTYDASVGGPGTYANFFTELGKRCGLLGTYNAAYDTDKVWNYLMAGWAPTEVRLATTSSTGGYVGAVKPVGLIGAFQ